MELPEVELPEASLPEVALSEVELVEMALVEMALSAMAPADVAIVALRTRSSSRRAMATPSRPVRRASALSRFDDG